MIIKHNIAVLSVPSQRGLPWQGPRFHLDPNSQNPDPSKNRLLTSGAKPNPSTVQTIELSFGDQAPPRRSKQRLTVYLVASGGTTAKP